MPLKKFDPLSAAQVRFVLYSVALACGAGGVASLFMFEQSMVQDGFVLAVMRLQILLWFAVIFNLGGALALTLKDYPELVRRPHLGKFNFKRGGWRRPRQGKTPIKHDEKEGEIIEKY